MTTAGDDFLDQHPAFRVTLEVVLLLVLLGMLALSVLWRRDRSAYLAQSARLARSDGSSSAYAQGFTALGWLVYLGFLLLIGTSIWVDLFGRTWEGKLWVLLASQACLLTGLILPYFYWPRWAMPPHARDDKSPFQQRVRPPKTQH